ncbi:MAG: hypothetical protein NC110_07325 [Ruminococcus sp.]|nr:hypothetical protein [Ruminococcus sp.]
MKEYKWCKTDTATIMFSSIDSKTQSRICRYSAVLKDEDVDPVILSKAVKEALKRYPIFSYRERKGFFWAYLEHTDKPVKVLPETLRPAALRRLGKDGGPEIEVLYYKRRISIDCSHIYADGRGFLELLKSIVAQYLIYSGMDKADIYNVRLSDEKGSETENENPYLRYHNKEKLKNLRRDKAYRLKKDYEPDYANSIFGLIPIDEIKAVSHEKNMTITEYLCCALIYSIIKTAEKPINETIIIAVPVDMRKYFPTDTIRNFANDVPIEFNPHGKTNVTFDEICAAVSGQMKAKNTKNTMQAFLNSSYSMMSNAFLRAIPFSIKHLGLNRLQKISHNNAMTVMLSNVGNVSLSPKMADKIERIDFIGGDARVYDLPMFCSVVGLNGFLNFCFSVTGKDVSVCREFFSLLSSKGITIRVESSDANGTENCRAEDIYPKACPCCGVEIGEEYTRCPLCGEKPVNGERKIDFFKTAVFPQPYEKVQQVPEAKGELNLSKERLKAYFNF